MESRAPGPRDDGRERSAAASADERDLRAFAEGLEDGIALWDSSFRLIYANPGLERTLGRAPAGKRPDELVGEPGGALQSALAAAFASGETAELTLPLATTSGVRVHRVRLAPAYDGAGRALSVLSIWHDMTGGQMRAARQSMLTSALDRVREAVYLIDEDANLLYVNERAAEMLGYPRDELMGRTVFDIAPYMTREGWREHWKRTSESELRPFETTHTGKDGRVVPVEIRVTHFDYDGRGYHLTLTQDLSERKAAESLASREHEFRTLAENIPDNVARYGPDGRCTYVNPTLMATLGMPRERLIGTRPTDNNPPGTHVFDDYEAMMLRVLQTGEPDTLELSWDSPNGREYHQIRMMPERDENGAVVGVLSLGRDFTERQTTLQALEEARRHAEDQAEELARARDAALAAARVKSEFLANMSHEIRTPMNGVLGLCDLLLSESLPPSARELAEGIQRSGVALLSILNDILDLSKLEAGRVELQEEPFDVVELLDDVAALLAARAHQQSLSLVVDPGDGTPRRWLGDTGRLRQVLLNLVGNAIKFTREGGVRLRASTEQSEGRVSLVLEVTDSGIGIPDDRLGAVFESFTQADGSISRRFGGTGLGLAISRQLVERMGGRIAVASQLGRGSTFTCTLPLPLAPAAAAEPELAGSAAVIVAAPSAARTVLEQQLTAWGVETRGVLSPAELEGAPRGRPVFVFTSRLDDAGRERVRQTLALTAEDVRFVWWSPGDTSRDAGSLANVLVVPDPIPYAHLRAQLATLARGTAPAPKAAPEAAPPPLDLDVLLVEDHAINRLVASRLLAGWGCRVTSAEDGVQALQCLEEKRFDIVLMDVQMPVMDGFTAVGLWRETERERGSYTPIVALTAHAMGGDRERCIAAGMDGYAAKPLRPAELRETMVRLLALRQDPPGAVEREAA